MVKIFLKPRYFLPGLYLLAALFFLVSEWGDTGFMARIYTLLIAAPWSIWIPEYLNFYYNDLFGNVPDTNILVLVIGILINSSLFYGIGWLVEYVYIKLKSKA